MSEEDDDWRVKAICAFTRSIGDLQVGSYPIVTFQYSSTTLYQFSYHIQYLFF